MATTTVESSAFASAAVADYWRARPSLAIPRMTPGRGRGLFATTHIAPGTLIERACSVQVEAHQTDALDAMQPLGDFYFRHPEDPEMGLIALGLMSLVNHADAPNAEIRWYRNEALGWLADLVAVQAIGAGTEITYRYKCDLWFDPRS